MSDEMADDRKRTERVPVYLTEREFLDLCRAAHQQDRKPAEMLRWMFRQSMYGIVQCRAGDGHGTESADGAA